MADEDTNLDAPEETPSEGAPAEETETPSAPEAEAEAEGEAVDEQTETPQRDPAWQNLAKKFAHIEDPQEREDAIAKAYWEKTNWASRVNKENQALKRQIAKIESEAKAHVEEKPETPAPPPEEIRELDARLKSLYEDDQALIKEANAQLSTLNEIDAEIAKAQARIEDAKEASDEQKLLRNEAKLAALEARKEAVVRGYHSTQRDRMGLSREYDRVMKERTWLDRAVKDRQTRQAQEAQESEEFRQEFPEEVAAHIERTAESLGIPPSYLEELQQEVSDGLLVDLWKLGEVDLDDADVPGLIRARVEKFMSLRNIASRRKFAETSKAKLRVSSTARPAGAATTPPKGKPKGPVTPESMNQGDRTSQMQKGRDYLISKGY